MDASRLRSMTARNVLVIALATGLFALIWAQPASDRVVANSGQPKQETQPSTSSAPGQLADLDILDYYLYSRMRSQDFLYDGDPTTPETSGPSDPQQTEPEPTEPSKPTEPTEPPEPVFKPVDYALYITASRLNLRSGPSLDDEIILVLRAGDKVKCEGEGDGWLQVRYKNELGYVKAEYTSTTMVFSAVNEYVTVSANTLNLRKGPSLDDEVSGKLYRNMVLKRIGIGDNWSKVETLSGTRGYVYSQYLRQLPVHSQTSFHSDADYSGLAQEEIDLFRKIVALEGHPKYGYEGYLAVATVILNRVERSRYPDTITGVVSQLNQFSVYDSPREPVYNAQVNQAIADALAGKRNLPDYVLAFITTAAYTKNVQNNGAFRYLPVYKVAYGTVWCYFG